LPHCITQIFTEWVVSIVDVLEAEISLTVVVFAQELGKAQNMGTLLGKFQVPTPSVRVISIHQCWLCKAKSKGF